MARELFFRAQWLHRLVLAAVCSSFFLLLNHTPFHDKGEPREALVVRDIVLNGNWLFPLRLGEIIPSKPPLFHWTGAAVSIANGRMTEATVRFPSALFASIAVFLLYYLGRRIYDAETGLLAGIALATTVVYQSAAVEARVDMTLTFFITACLVLFFSIYSGFVSHAAWTYLFFAVAGLGVLAKGPVSLILCAIVVLAFLAIRRRWDWVSRLTRHPGLWMGAAIFLFWYGSALWSGGSEFAGLQFFKENFARFFIHGEGGTGHQKPFHYFFPYLFTLGMPWSLFLPLVLWLFFASRQHRQDGPLFLALWVAVVFVFFSMSAGKRPPYILPLYPALSLLTAACLLDLERQGLPGSRIYLKVIGGFAAAIGMILMVILFGYWLGWTATGITTALSIRLDGEARAELQVIEAGLRSAGWWLSLFLVVSSALWLLMARGLTSGGLRKAAFLTATLSLWNVYFIQSAIMPGLARAHTYKDFVEAALSRVGNGRPLPVYLEHFEYSSVFFYGGKRVEALEGDHQQLQQRLRQPPSCVVMAEQTWRELTRETSTSWNVILRSQSRGPDGDHPILLVSGAAGAQADIGCASSEPQVGIPSQASRGIP